MGLMQAIEFVADDGRPDAARAGAFVSAARRHGLILGKGGMGGNVIRIAPPLIVTAEQIEEAARVMGLALQEVA